MFLFWNEIKFIIRLIPTTNCIIPIKNIELTTLRVVSELMTEVMAMRAIRPRNKIGPSQRSQLLINDF